MKMKTFFTYKMRHAIRNARDITPFINNIHIMETYTGVFHRIYCVALHFILKRFTGKCSWRLCAMRVRGGAR